MKKSIEIEIPDGKVEKISRDGDTISIKFVDADICERVKTLDDAIKIAKKSYPELYKKWENADSDSYEENLYAYRMVVAVLTNNEKNHLVSGDRYIPYVDFCDPGKEKNCGGKTIVGHIESEGRKFTVVGGLAYAGGYAGLGYFLSYAGVSNSYMSVGFRSVSSRKIAEHISKYFGRLVFDLMYGESNCDYKWID